MKTEQKPKIFTKGTLKTECAVVEEWERINLPPGQTLEKIIRACSILLYSINGSFGSSLVALLVVLRWWKSFTNAEILVLGIVFLLGITLSIWMVLKRRELKEVLSNFEDDAKELGLPEYRGLKLESAKAAERAKLVAAAVVVLVARLISKQTQSERNVEEAEAAFKRLLRIAMKFGLGNGNETTYYDVARKQLEVLGLFQQS